MTASSGTGVIAVVGAATGVASLLWNVLRAARERENLYVSFNVSHEDSFEHQGPVAMIGIVNHGKYPAHIVSVGISQEREIPWHWRWPFRSFSFKTRNRAMFGFLRRILGRKTTTFLRLQLGGTVLPPRELLSYRVDRPDHDIELCC